MAMRQGASTQELEHDKFTDTPNAQPAVLTEGIDVLGPKIVDQANPNVVYTGRADYGASINDPVWQIRRDYSIGTEVFTDYADNGNYTNTWANRGTAFPANAFINTTSTYFDGVNDFVNLGNNLNFLRLDPWTMSFWIRPQAATSTVLFGKTGSNKGIYILKDFGQKIRVYIIASAVNRIELTSALGVNASAYNHVVITYDGSSLSTGVRIFINNTESTFTTQFNTLTLEIDNNSNASLGALNGALYYNGHMDEVSIWDKALTNAEIYEIYGVGEPLDLLVHSAYLNLISWYHMGDGDVYPTILDHKDGNNGTMNNMTVANFQGVIP